MVRDNFHMTKHRVTQNDDALANLHRKNENDAE